MKAQSTLSPFTRSSNLQHLVASATITISQEAQRRRAAGDDVLDLSAGEPDFATPRVVSEAGIKAIQQGKTHYPPNAGILELRAAAARHLSLLSGGRPVNADNIIVSTGAKQGIFNACFALFNPGDEVLIPSPAWVSYPQIVHLARAKPILVPGDPQWGLKVGIDQLKAATTDETAGLILASPVNPTGAVYSKTELNTIVAWARDRNLWIIADEIYRRIHYGTGPAPSVLDLPDEMLEQVVMVSGVSKTYAMTGWRIGLTLAPRELAAAMGALQTHVTSGASHPAQWAAYAALSDDRVEADVARMVRDFAKRRELVVGHFRRTLPGVEFVDPLGAFYFFFRVDAAFRGAITSAASFCEALMEETGVALVPGEAFGDARWVRLSYAVSERELKKALDRIASFFIALTQGGSEK